MSDVSRDFLQARGETPSNDIRQLQDEYEDIRIGAVEGIVNTARSVIEGAGTFRQNLGDQLRTIGQPPGIPGDADTGTDPRLGQVIPFADEVTPEGGLTGTITVRQPGISRGARDRILAEQIQQEVDAVVAIETANGTALDLSSDDAANNFIRANAPSAGRISNDRLSSLPNYGALKAALQPITDLYEERQQLIEDARAAGNQTTSLGAIGVAAQGQTLLQRAQARQALEQQGRQQDANAIDSSNPVTSLGAVGFAGASTPLAYQQGLQALQAQNRATSFEGRFEAVAPELAQLGADTLIGDNAGFLSQAGGLLGGAFFGPFGAPVGTLLGGILNSLTTGDGWLRRIFQKEEFIASDEILELLPGLSPSSVVEGVPGPEEDPFVGVTNMDEFFERADDFNEQNEGTEIADSIGNEFSAFEDDNTQFGGGSPPIPITTMDPLPVTFSEEDIRFFEDDNTRFGGGSARDLAGATFNFEFIANNEITIEGEVTEDTTEELVDTLTERLEENFRDLSERGYALLTSGAIYTDG